MEALVALMCFLAFAATLSAVRPEGYGTVVLHKQAGDYAQVAMKKRCEHDEECLAGLREMLGRGSEGEKCALVTRTSVSESLEYTGVTFSLCV